MFGTTNPWMHSLVLPMHEPSLPDARNLVALLYEPVEHEGDVFAFLARVHHAEPFYFQIWRPTSNPSEIQLIASRQVIPSVGSKQHENVRLTALCTICYFVVLRCDS